ncbi:MAG TPA: hypothetical protein VK176_07945 [Phycisphaerales bacterium]|nr:hypothetical protein [Phycisphaerales bacterium]
MQPLGPELVRRWVAALMLVHASEREAVVSAVERQLAHLYPLDVHDQSAAQQPGTPPTRKQRTA